MSDDDLRDVEGGGKYEKWVTFNLVDSKDGVLKGYKGGEHMVMQLRIDKEKALRWKHVRTGEVKRYYSEDWGIDSGMWMNPEDVKVDKDGREYVEFHVTRRVRRSRFEVLKERWKRWRLSRKKFTWVYDEQ